MEMPATAASAMLERASSNLAEAAAKARDDRAETAARDFEAVFLSTMLSEAFTGIDGKPPFGGGNAEKTWRGFLIEEYAKGIAAKGGLGLADRIKQELLALQEVSS